MDPKRPQEADPSETQIAQARLVAWCDPDGEPVTSEDEPPPDWDCCGMCGGHGHCWRKDDEQPPHGQTQGPAAP